VRFREALMIATRIDTQEKSTPFETTEKLWELIKNIHIAMLTTTDSTVGA
jgi:16S rRNA C1402 N4-methylase RsmH